MTRCSKCQSFVDTKEQGFVCVGCGQTFCDEHIAAMSEGGTKTTCTDCWAKFIKSLTKLTEPRPFRAEIYWDRSVAKEGKFVGEFVVVEFPAWMRQAAECGGTRSALDYALKKAFTELMEQECSFVRLEDECKECNERMYFDGISYHCPTCKGKGVKK